MLNLPCEVGKMIPYSPENQIGASRPHYPAVQLALGPHRETGLYRAGSGSRERGGDPSLPHLGRRVLYRVRNTQSVTFKGGIDFENRYRIENKQTEKEVENNSGNLGKWCCD